MLTQISLLLYPHAFAQRTSMYVNGCRMYFTDSRYRYLKYIRDYTRVRSQKYISARRRTGNPIFLNPEFFRTFSPRNFFYAQLHLWHILNAPGKSFIQVKELKPTFLQHITIQSKIANRPQPFPTATRGINVYFYILGIDINSTKEASVTSETGA